MLSLQRAISQTQEASSVEVAHKLPSGPTRSYWIGWDDLEKDLLYAMSLGETACKQHLSLWNDELPLENDTEVGYLARVVKIKSIMEGI